MDAIRAACWCRRCVFASRLFLLRFVACSPLLNLEYKYVYVYIMRDVVRNYNVRWCRRLVCERCVRGALALAAARVHIVRPARPGAVRISRRRRRLQCAAARPRRRRRRRRAAGGAMQGEHC